MKLPDGLSVSNGYFRFRKQVKGRPIIKSFGPATEENLAKVKPKVLGLLADISQGRYDFDEVHSITVNEAVDLEEQLHKPASPHMFRTAYKVMRLEWGTRQLESICYEDVEELREKLTEEGVLARYHNGELTVLPVTDATANRVQTVISGMFNRLERWMLRGIIRKIKLPENNPCKGVAKTHEEARTRVLSEEEFERLLVSASPRVAEICKAAVKTLLRLADLEHPKKGYWDPLRGVLTGIQNKTGKPFSIPLAAPVPEGLDFSNFRREFAEAVRRANIKDFLFMDLRRTGATWLHRANTPLKTISLYLGHKSVQTTERYLGIVSSDLKKASNILEEKVNKASKAAEELGRVGEFLAKKDTAL